MFIRIRHFRNPQILEEYSRHLSQQSKQGRQWEVGTWGYKDNYDQVMQKYHRRIYGIDQATGMILSALEDNGLENDTIIIYTSDNGFLWISWIRIEGIAL